MARLMKMDARWRFDGPLRVEWNKWFSATVLKLPRNQSPFRPKTTWQFVSKFSRASKPSRIDFLGHSPKLLECDMLQAHGSKWPVTQMTDKKRWKMKDALWHMWFCENKICVDDLWWVTEKVIVFFLNELSRFWFLRRWLTCWQANMERISCQTLHALFFFLISAKYCKKVVSFWSTKPPSTG